MAVQQQLLGAVTLVVALLLLEGSVVVLQLGVGYYIDDALRLLVDDTLHFLRPRALIESVRSVLTLIEHVILSVSANSSCLTPESL